MNSIWVVEQGSYSDYRVVGVFSSKKNADVVCEKINATESYEKASVAKWPLDPAIKELNAGLSQFNILMLRDGATERADSYDFSPYEIGGRAEIWRRSQAPAYRGKGIPDILHAIVWAKDLDHAIKSVNEIRTKMIADGRWE